jgi:hypothetical protein
LGFGLIGVELGQFLPNGWDWKNDEAQPEKTSNNQKQEQER